MWLEFIVFKIQIETRHVLELELWRPFHQCANVLSSYDNDGHGDHMMMMMTMTTTMVTTTVVTKMVMITMMVMTTFPSKYWTNGLSSAWRNTVNFFSQQIQHLHHYIITMYTSFDQGITSHNHNNCHVIITNTILITIISTVRCSIPPPTRRSNPIPSIPSHPIHL